MSNCLSHVFPSVVKITPSSWVFLCMSLLCIFFFFVVLLLSSQTRWSLRHSFSDLSNIRISEKFCFFFGFKHVISISVLTCFLTFTYKMVVESRYFGMICLWHYKQIFRCWVMGKTSAVWQVQNYSFLRCYILGNSKDKFSQNCCSRFLPALDL